MNFTKKQYKRANKVMLVCILVLCCIMIMANLAMVVSLEKNGLYKFFIGFFVVCGCLISLSYKLFSEDNRAEYLMAAIWIIMGVLGIYSTSACQTYSISYTVMVACVVYMDLKLTILMDVATALTLFSNIFYSAVIKKEALDNSVVVIVVATCLIISVGCIVLTLVFRKVMFENESKIKERVDEQDKIVKGIAHTSGEVAAIFEEVNEDLSNINEQTQKNKSFMKDLSESMDATAEEIQNQAISTSEIQKIIGKTDKHAASVRNTADIVLQTVNRGVSLSKTVMEQSDKVNDYTSKMMEKMQTLSKRVSDVTTIVETILSISNQTNLLALNASIEAARAGEAGRGFAVVAEEIRVLSEDTRVSTSKITDIISDLTVAANDTLGILTESVTSIQLQGEKVGEMNESFIHTGKDVSELIELLNEIHNDISVLHTSNQVIVDAISQLSGTTEEVTAVSQEGYEISEIILDRMERFNQLINQVNGLINELEEIVKTES